MNIIVLVPFRGPDRWYRKGEVIEVLDNEGDDLIALRFASRAPAAAPIRHKRRDMRAER